MWPKSISSSIFILISFFFQTTIKKTLNANTFVYTPWPCCLKRDFSRFDPNSHLDNTSGLIVIDSASSSRNRRHQARSGSLGPAAAAMAAFLAPPCTSFYRSSAFLTPCSSNRRSTALRAAAVRGSAVTRAQRTVSARWVPSRLAVARPAARKACLEELDTTNMLLRQRIVFLGSPVSSLIRFFRKISRSLYCCCCCCFRQNSYTRFARCGCPGHTSYRSKNKIKCDITQCAATFMTSNPGRDFICASVLYFHVYAFFFCMYA